MPKDGERPLTAEEQEFIRGLYLRHYQALINCACRLGIGTEAAEDYVQDAFITAIRHIEDLKETKSRRRYLNQALKNVIGYQLRSLRYAINLQKKLQEGMDPPQEEGRADALGPETLYRGAVSDAELGLLIRFYLDGWTQKELAEKMGISENAVKLRIKRAKAHLRSALEDKLPGPEDTPEARSRETERRREQP